MPFDSEVQSSTTAPHAALSLTVIIDKIADPEAAWAAARPDRALAFLMVSPRDCAALDAL